MKDPLKIAAEVEADPILEGAIWEWAQFNVLGRTRESDAIAIKFFGPLLNHMRELEARLLYSDQAEELVLLRAVADASERNVTLMCQSAKHANNGCKGCMVALALASWRSQTGGGNEAG